jgi:hypothetical protein
MLSKKIDILCASLGATLEIDANQPDAASFMILTIVSSTSCATLPVAAR